MLFFGAGWSLVGVWVLCFSFCRLVVALRMSLIVFCVVAVFDGLQVVFVLCRWLGC